MAMENENMIVNEVVNDEVFEVFEMAPEKSGWLGMIAGGLAVVGLAAAGVLAFKHFKKKGRKNELIPVEPNEVNIIPEDDDRFNEE